MNIRRFVHTILSGFGIGLYSLKSRRLWEERQRLWFNQLNAQTVIDVGANIGQFAKSARKAFPTARIYSFEPLPNCFRALTQNFVADKNFTAFPIALGANEELSEINENEFSQSSSILDMLQLHKKVLPITENHKRTKIQIKRLDDLRNELVLQKPILIKLDVQGFEENVIKGGEHTIDMADFIIIEMTFVPLYNDQPIFDDLYVLLRSKGFELRGCYDAFTDVRTGQMLQTDGLFVRVRNVIRAN